MSAANASCGFSILADETADISGEEQLSLGVHFVDTTNDKPAICEEFLEFTSLTQLDAKTKGDNHFLKVGGRSRPSDVEASPLKVGGFF